MSCINHPSTTHFLVRFRRERILQFRSCLTLLACLPVFGIPSAHAQFSCPAPWATAPNVYGMVLLDGNGNGPPVTSPRPSTNMRAPLANSPRSDKVFARGRQHRKLDLA